ncbi:MAG: GEVED domain-containing protein [Chitinophagales bacterium]
MAFLFSIQHALAQYCIPEYVDNCASEAYINKFTFNSINNSTSGCNGNANNYILYPESGNTTTSVELGGTYNLTVKSNNDDGTGVWIDYNNDNDFDDAGELVYSTPFYDNILFSGAVTIPNNADYIGQRRLRVRGALQTLLFETNSCSVFTNGETEDYTITINPAPPCSGLPVAGTVTAFPSSICAEGNTSELHLNNYSVASAILIEWDSSADANSWSPISGASGNVYTTAPLYQNTFYRAKVTCLNSGQVTYSNEVKISVGEVMIWSVLNDSVCGPGIAHLQVLANATTVSWYNSETAVVPLYTSTFPFQFSPSVSNTKTFYASASSGLLYIDSLGLKDNTAGSGSDAYQNDYLVFNISHACKLSGVYVYPSAAGNVIIQLRDKNFNPIKTDTLIILASQVNKRTFLELNFNLEQGTGFQLTLLDGSVPLWSNQSGVSFPYEIPSVLSLYNSNLGPNYYFYFYNWVVNYTDQCETARTPVTAIVSNPPPLNITTFPSTATICGNSGLEVEINTTPGYIDYTWQPLTGLSSGFGSNVIAAPLVTTTYTLVASDSICQNVSSVTIFVANTPAIAIDATADSICGGTSAQLFAMATPLFNYTVNEIAFSPDSTSGLPVLLQEDEVSPSLPIGFSFKFFGSFYSTFKISSNGFITFDSIAFDGCCAGQKLPDIFQPNNLIAFAWEDLSPQLGGSVSYFVSGTAPYRKLVIRFDSVPHYTFTGSSDPITAQVHLYETNNYIEVHTTSMPGNPDALWFTHTMGIENATGTLGTAVPGRNGSNTWTAYEDAWQFVPAEYVYDWSPAASLNDPTFSNPVATPAITTDYTVIVIDTSTECFSSANIKINVINTPVAGIIQPQFETFCEEGFDTLTLSGYTSGASLQWLDAKTSGGPYSEISGASNPVFITPLLDTATYYIAKVSCTNSAFTEEAMLQVLPVPAPPTGDSVYRCGAGKVDLEASGTGGSISWYDAATGGNYLGQGSLFTSPSISQSTVFWAEEGPPVAPPLPTIFIGGNIADGSMFDITAINTIVITGFDGHIGSGQTSDLEIYYKKGSYEGFESDAEAWTFFGAENSVAGQGIGIPTPYPFEINLTIPAGYTYSFYITSKTNIINYTYGTLEGNVFASDDNIKVAEGNAIAYPFGSVTEPVQWNGIIHYHTIGCPSKRTPIQAIVNYPDISTLPGSSSVCEGDSISFTAINNGPGNYNYQWLPLLPNMNPADGAAATITLKPATTVTLTLTATEVNTGCDTNLLIPVTALPLPIAAFTGLPDSALVTDDPYLLSGNPTGGSFSGNGIAGYMFDPSLAGIGGPYPIAYFYSDPNGCFDDTVQYITVVVDIGTHDLTDENSLAIFPNPAAGQFVMRAQFPIPSGELIITVHDIYGRLVFEDIVQHGNAPVNYSFDFTNQPKGSYFIEVNGGGKVLRKKIVLQ